MSLREPVLTPFTLDALPGEGIPLSDEELPELSKCARKRSNKKVRASEQSQALDKCQVAPSQTVVRSHVSCDYQHTKRKAIVIQVPNTRKSFAATVSPCEVVVHPAVNTRKPSLAASGSARVVFVQPAVITRKLSLAASGSARIVVHPPATTRQVSFAAPASRRVIVGPSRSVVVHRGTKARKRSFDPPSFQHPRTYYPPVSQCPPLQPLFSPPVVAFSAGCTMLDMWPGIAHRGVQVPGRKMAEAAR